MNIFVLDCLHKLLALIVIVLLSTAAEALTQTRPDEVSKQQSGLTRLPDSVINAEITLVGARTLKLSDYAGKVIVINLFATWCAPCRLESPDLAKLHEEFRDRGLVVIELSVENANESKEIVREWVWDFRLPYQVGWATPEILTLMQGRTAIPQAFVIARDGQIIKRFIGYNRDVTLDQMRATVEEALK